METQQINLKLSENLIKAAQSYAKNFGYRNVQDLATHCMREKIFDKNEFDETFKEKEIDLIDELITKTIKNKDFSTEEELKKALEE